MWNLRSQNSPAPLVANYNALYMRAVPARSVGQLRKVKRIVDIRPRLARSGQILAVWKSEDERAK